MDFPIQLNGKLLCVIQAPDDCTIKTVMVPGKLLNIVVKEKEPEEPIDPDEINRVHALNIPEVQ